METHAFLETFKDEGRKLSNIVLIHGLVAFLFSLIYMLQACGWAFPLLSLESLNADYHGEDSFTQVRAACLLVFLGVATFAQYEIFFFPAYLRKLEEEGNTKAEAVETKKLIKTLFIMYHVPWAISSVYIATRPEAMWNSWLYVVTMVGFTVWPMVSPEPVYSLRDLKQAFGSSNDVILAPAPVEEGA